MLAIILKLGGSAQIAAAMNEVEPFTETLLRTRGLERNATEEDTIYLDIYSVLLSTRTVSTL